MTFVLLIAIVVITGSYIKHSHILKKHSLVSEIAQERRDLIKLVHSGKVSVNSEIFKLIYYNLEYLLRIKYYDLNHMLPSLDELRMQYVISQHDKERLDKIKKELNTLSEDKEIMAFLKSFNLTFTRAILQKKFLWQILRIMAKTKILKISKRAMKLRQTEKNIKDFNSLMESYAG